jgi:hypothetical protein
MGFAALTQPQKLALTSPTSGRRFCRYSSLAHSSHGVGFLCHIRPKSKDNYVTDFKSSDVKLGLIYQETSIGNFRDFFAMKFLSSWKIAFSWVHARRPQICYVHAY